MNADEALRFVEDRLAKRSMKPLNDTQRAVFLGSWEGEDYKEIQQNRCAKVSEVDHLKRNVGPDLWKLLSEVFGETIRKNYLRGPIERAWQQKTDASNGKGANGGGRSQSNSGSASGHSRSTHFDTDRPADLSPPDPLPAVDGFLPSVPLFYGRTQELEYLNQQIRMGCRVMTLCGMGGVGKTALAVKLVEHMKDPPPFEGVIWRSLNPPPPMHDLLADLTRTLSHQTGMDGSLSGFLPQLINHRCLIVLDQMELVLQGGVHNGSYRAGYEGYREFLLQIGNTEHQSCLLLTSREKPREIASMEGEPHHVCALELDGLGGLAGRGIFDAKGRFDGQDGDWSLLIRRYAGNPSALSSVATAIRDVYDSNIASFLERLQRETAIFGEIRDLLRQQMARLSEAEKAVIYCLTHQGEPATLDDILNQVVPAIPWDEMGEVLQSLRRRSLIELNSKRYTLHPLVMEYVATTHSVAS